MPTGPTSTESLRHSDLTKPDPDQLLQRHLILRDVRMLGPLSTTTVQSKSSKVRAPISSLSVKDACSVSLTCSDPNTLALYQQSLGLVSRPSQRFVEKLSPSSKAGVHPDVKPASPDQPGSPLQQALASRSSPGMMFHSPTPRPGDRVEDSRATDLSDKRYSPYRLHRRPSSTSPTPQTQSVRPLSVLHSSETSATLTTSVTPSPSSFMYRNHPQTEARSQLSSSHPTCEDDLGESLTHLMEKDNSLCDTKIALKPAQGKRLDSLLHQKTTSEDSSKRQEQDKQSRSPSEDSATSQKDTRSASPAASPKSSGVLTPPPPLKPSLPATAATEKPHNIATATSKLSPSLTQTPTTPTSPASKPANKPTAFSVADILDPSKFTGSSSVPRVPVWNPWKIAAGARQAGKIGQDSGKSPSGGEKLGELHL